MSGEKSRSATNAWSPTKENEGHGRGRGKVETARTRFPTALNNGTDSLGSPHGTRVNPEVEEGSKRGWVVLESYTLRAHTSALTQPYTYTPYKKKGGTDKVTPVRVTNHTSTSIHSHTLSAKTK